MKDYEFTPYIAELFNTLTNLTYILLGVHGIIRTRNITPSSIGPALPYVALISLGIASSAFHSTLLYPAQMYDEFSMLIATFIVTYRLFSFSQSRFSDVALSGGLAGLMVIAVVAQVVTGDSTVQQIIFTVMVYWLWRECFRLIAMVEGNFSVRKQMKWMAISGIGTYRANRVSLRPS